MGSLTAAIADRSVGRSSTCPPIVGSPVALSRAMQVGMPIDNIRWAAEKAIVGPPGGYEEALPPHFGTPPSSSLLCREPAGVVAGITGYNFPINSVVWKLGPALAAGCTIVVKPSERTSLSSMALVRLAQEAGFPEGVVNLVLGAGDVGRNRRGLQRDEGAHPADREEIDWKADRLHGTEEPPGRCLTAIRGEEVHGAMGRPPRPALGAVEQ